MDAENACNGRKANGSHLDNGRVNEFQSACSIRCVHDLKTITTCLDKVQYFRVSDEPNLQLQIPEMKDLIRDLK